MKIIIFLALIASSFVSCTKEYTCSCKKTDTSFPAINTTEEFTIKATKNNSVNKCAENNQTEATFTVVCEIK